MALGSLTNIANVQTEKTDFRKGILKAWTRATDVQSFRIRIIFFEEREMAYLLALVPALCWGGIGLLSGKLGGTARQQTLGMVLGGFLFAVIYSLFGIKEFIAIQSAFLWLIGISSGFLWATGQAFQFVAMKNLGISKTYPVSTGSQLVCACLSGALVFGEWQTKEHFALGITALVILVTGITFTSVKERKPSGKNTETKSHENKSARGSKKLCAGIFALVVSTLGFCGQAVLVRASELDGKYLMLPQAFGWLLGGIVFALRKDSFSKATFRNMLTGFSFGIGNLFFLISVTNLGLAISFPLSQTGAVISTLGPVFLLGEKKTKKELLFAVLGCVLIITGGFFVGRTRG